MFSWICARCGRDNPPSAVVCSNCGARFDDPPEAEAASTAPEPAATPHSVSAEAPASSPMTSSVAKAPVRQASRSGMPTWLLLVVSFLAIIGVVSAVSFGITWMKNRKQATSTGLDPAANNARTKLSSPLQKYIEVVGIRLTEDTKRKPEARFVVVNHSPDTFDNLTATVTIWASTQRSEEDSVGTFQFKIPSLGPYESRDLAAPFATKLKFYELPDWQNVNPDVQITSP